MAEQRFLFAEMQLQAGDVIDCKGKRLFFCNSRKFQEIGKTGVNYV